MKETIDRILGGVLIVLMGLSVVNVLWQVFTRFVLGDPSSFTDELARYLLIWIGLLGAAYATGQRLHLAIDLLPSRWTGDRRRHLGRFIEASVFLFALVVLVIGGSNLVSLTLMLGQTSAALKLPLGYVYLIVPVSGLLMAYYAAHFYQKEGPDLVKDTLAILLPFAVVLGGAALIGALQLEWAAVLVLVGTFVFFLLVGVPVAFSIGLSTVITMLLTILPLPALTTMAQRMATGLDSFTLLAIPFFILAGQLMNQGGIAPRLIDFAKSIFGMLPGGLAFVNVVANMLFGAISGSAVAAASAIGGVMAPRMEDEGYDRDFAAAVNITSATTGLIIPPSNILIVYSLASGGVSIAALFLAGYLPGLVVGLSISVVAAVIAMRRGYPTSARESFGSIMRAFVEAVPSLFLLIVVIGGIVAGIFTATEAAAVAVLYALVLGFIYREISVGDLPDVLLKSAATTAIVMLLIATSVGMSWILSYENIPQNVSAALVALSDNPIVILLIINVILLAVGTFMDMTPAVLIFTPIFLPIATGLGIDPVHFGILMVLNLSIGLCTPPVGSVLFVGVGVAQTTITKVIRPLLPMFIAMLVALLLVTYIPGLSLWLPGLFGY
ncbi:MAG: hypothetical protein RhofKO_16320 [Rhodothermales bacterium]